MTVTPATARSDVPPGSSLPDAPTAQPSRTPTIGDKYADLLRPLNNRQRRAIVLRLTFSFYEGWRPSREEMADLVAVELDTLNADEAWRRQRLRALSTSGHRGRGPSMSPEGLTGK